MKYDYTDEYLASGGVINDEMEARAIREVAQYGLVNEFYIEKLTILRTYIICCLENQTQENDLYEIKLKHYKEEYKGVLEDAQIDLIKTQNADKDKDGKLGLSKFNCPLARG